MPPDLTLAALEALVKASIEHFDKVLELLEGTAAERDRRYSERFDSQQRETDLARIAMNDRLEAMNEIRAQLAVQQRTFSTREALDAVLGRVGELERRANLSTGKETGGAGFKATMFASVAAAGSIVAIILTLVNLLGG